MVKSALEVRYLDDVSTRALLSQSELVFAVVGYGAPRPEYLPSACPFVAAPLAPLTDRAMFEVWTAQAPAVPFQLGPVTGACADDLAFGTITLEESADAPFEDTVEAAYHRIFDFLDQVGCDAPLRFWNYLVSISGVDRGLERYMRFNTGRHRAFSARLRQPVPPAASGVGGHRGASVIYFLAAREAAVPIENPRQVSAFAYPAIYGPTSPSFSRASIYSQGGAEVLFISGTASIVGHKTRHVGSLAGQLSETIDNLKALIEVADRAAPPVGKHPWALKLYLRDAADHDAVDAATIAMFGPDTQRLYLHGDICRPGLLVEIEAFRSRAL